ncbi:MAG: aminopeptidase P family protein [Bacteriovoracaceae bacterium]
METTNFKSRRKKVLSLIGPSIAIIKASTYKTRSNDTAFPFRQDSNFKYLTGFPEPDALLVLCQNNSECHEILFVHEKDPTRALWEGDCHGVKETQDLYDFDKVYPIEEFSKVLPDLIKGHENVYLDLYDESLTSLRTLVHKEMTALHANRRLKQKPINIKHIAPILGRLRLKKSKNELALIKQACEISKKTHKQLMSYCSSGKNEADLYRLLLASFAAQGAKEEAYTSIIASGNNANTLHYIENNSEIQENDLVLIDAGCEFNGYASDITRTFPANGKFTDIQADLYNAVLESQKNAIAKAKPGNTLSDIHNASTRTLSMALKDFGIFTESVDEIIEKGLIRKYFPHGTGHWLGLDVHDPCPSIDEQGEPIILSEGMVFTIEPGLYFNSLLNDTPEKFKGLGVRIEDDIVITKDGHENLTSGTPKEIKEIEEQCNTPFDPAELF